MDVEVDEAGRDDLVRCVINFCVIGREPLTDGSNLAIFNQHISDAIQLRCWVDDAAAFQNEFCHACFPPVSTKV